MTLPEVRLTEPVDQGGAPGAQRLHLGADQHQAGLDHVVDVIVVAGLAVLCDELAPLLLRHPAILSAATTRFDERTSVVEPVETLRSLDRLDCHEEP